MAAYQVSHKTLGVNQILCIRQVKPITLIHICQIALQIFAIMVIKKAPMQWPRLHILHITFRWLSIRVRFFVRCRWGWGPIVVRLLLILWRGRLREGAIGRIKHVAYTMLDQLSKVGSTLARLNNIRSMLLLYYQLAQC